MKFTLKQLQVFLQVARHQNISRAAQELHMSQSATSEALLNLEHSYEIALFDRSRNKLALNAVGRTVRKEAEALLAHCQGFEQALLAHKEIGHIKVGASFTIGNHLATRYLAGYLSQYPDADVQLDIANTPEIHERIEQLLIDLRRVFDPLRTPGGSLELSPKFPKIDPKINQLRMTTPKGPKKGCSLVAETIPNVPMKKGIEPNKPSATRKVVIR